MEFAVIQSLLIGVVLLVSLGFLFGLGLAVIARVFKVNVDPRITDIENDILPGANCGACGYAGCSAYAQALVLKDEEINLCSPGGEDVIKKLTKILGKEGTAKEKYVAKVFCLGDDAIAQKDYLFNGEDDCTTIYNYFQGEKSCKYGCVGGGNCIRVCPVEAIKRDSLNRVWIDSNICIGCEKCVSVCPTHVIKMVPLDGGYFVACSSHDPGKIVRKVCKKGCIACKICEKTASVDRIQVIDNVAVVSFDSDIDLHAAAIKCPADVIVPIKNQKWFMIDNKKYNKELSKV